MVFKMEEWLHYNEALDVAFCHLCGKADQEEKLSSSMKDQAFLSKGFSNWKDGTESFQRHQESKCHQDALQVMLVVPCGDAMGMLSTEHASNKKKTNRRILLRIFQNVQFLG